ncbi:hypothetical protein [Radiobacillus sp. PE A8.2]|uniref:hypothetical protein n=1 Tax=Radiobacillus sp. PE A8.2 TaxID=3380349 RepID=UPI00388FC71A
MKQFLLAFGLIFVLVVAGCSQEDETPDTNTNDNQETEGQENAGQEENAEENAEDQEASEQEVKTALLDTQLELAELVSPYQQAVNTYQGLLGDEEAAAEDVEAAKEAALTAATDAQTALEGFEVNADLPTEKSEQLNGALDSLVAYYGEVQTTIEAGETDFATAQTKWDEFQASIATIYEEVGLIVPDMAAVLG